MSNPRFEWSSAVGNTEKLPFSEFDRRRNKREYEYADDGNNDEHNSCFDKNCLICNKERTKIGYRQTKSSFERTRDPEKEQLIEEFQYNVAKNCAATEKKVYKALEISSDEIIRLNNKIDMLNKMFYESKPLNNDDIKDYIDSRLFELHKKNNSAFEELEHHNQKLSFELDNIK